LRAVLSAPVSRSDLGVVIGASVSELFGQLFQQRVGDMLA
jgi:hypothetical protein